MHGFRKFFVCIKSEAIKRQVIDLLMLCELFETVTDISCMISYKLLLFFMCFSGKRVVAVIRAATCLQFG